MPLDGGRLASALLAMVAVIAFATVVASRAGAGVTQLSEVTKTVLLVGDSVPKSFADEFADAAAEHDYVVVSAATGRMPSHRGGEGLFVRQEVQEQHLLEGGR